MGYTVNGQDVACDDQGYVLEADARDEVSQAIAEAEGIVLTDAHWEVIRYLRDEFAASGHTPNFRNMVKGCSAAPATACQQPWRSRQWWSVPRHRRSR